MRYKKISVNTRGRDFVVGDLHGRYSVLKRLLKDVWFSPYVDRLFLVGDLIDRGPESEKCLKLLLKPWCYAVQGNHERVFCDVVFNISNSKIAHAYWGNDFGGGWTRDWFWRNAPELRFWSKILYNLPYVLEVGSYNVEPFWVVHAELWSPSYDITYTNILEVVENANAAQAHVFQWSRMLVKQNFLGGNLSLPGPIYCGHTPINNPGTSKLGHVNLDGGAGIGADWATKLGVVTPKMFMWCHTNKQGFSHPIEF